MSSSGGVSILVKIKEHAMVSVYHTFKFWNIIRLFKTDNYPDESN